MSSNNNNKKNSSFDKYCSRLGYPNNMAKDAQNKLGTQASTSELLAAVLNNAKANNVQPNRLAQPGYLQKQVGQWGVVFIRWVSEVTSSTRLILVVIYFSIL